MLSITIPKEDPDTLFDKNLKFTDNELPFVSALTGSVNGHLFQILYSLKIFVKHASVMHRGEGECITLPIKIMERPNQVDLGNT